MELLNVISRCVLPDSELFRHIGLALERGLPEIGWHFAHNGVAVLVGSGPSVQDEFDSIKEERERGRPIIALKDAHDWLIERGVIPDYAVAIDPQEHRWNCFKHKRPGVRYMIASQCHPAMFDHLSGADVYLWHLYIRKGQAYPPKRFLVAGGTTTGLRAITLFYVLGFRRFELYGYDSCLRDGVLRVNGDRTEKEILEVIVGGKSFMCNPSMAGQADEFERVYDVMPDSEITAHGGGLIAAILEQRKLAKPLSVSFIHKGGPGMASFRYRAEIPCMELANSGINDHGADVLIFSKPMENEVSEAKAALAAGKRVIVDFCDDHFDWPHYRQMLALADAVTCPTTEMAKLIKDTGLRDDAVVIDDPYEFEQAAPHCAGNKLLWFGHAVNYGSLERVRPRLEGFPLRIVSNVEGTIPWSTETLLREMGDADIVVLPANALYKSANRAVEAVRRGCFVVAEPHPSLVKFPGIWVGDLREGIEWASQNHAEANSRTLAAQSYVAKAFSPTTLAFAWKTVISAPRSTSAPVRSTGTDG